MPEQPALRLVRVMIHKAPDAPASWYVVISEVIAGDVVETRGPGGPKGRALTRRILQTMANHLAMYPTGGA